ncbi:deadc395-74dd-47b2-ae8d-789066212d3f [Sclerotinia trifoliorum]|uniref:Deadc395-74dd-47b2-ae8d-789066212d3f n=1 Tax=Sclerotinia trifoliorum TaxID=28548 RepID=A0A8H2W433_9HELO|nr:deadc395-74dd-47b2-ae8d-789066212d3f [Sclerotinia trifoliorum]
MPSFQPKSKSKAPSSPTKKHHPILTKTKSGEISKKTKKAILNAKYPPAKSPTQLLRRLSSKKQTALLRGVQGIEKQNVSEFGDSAVHVSERMDVKTTAVEFEKELMDIETTALEPEEEPMDIETKPSPVKIVKKPASRKPDSKKAMSGGISKKMRKALLSIKSASKAPSKALCKAPSKPPLKWPPKSPFTSPSASPSATSFTTSFTTSPTPLFQSPLKTSLRSPSNPSPVRHLHRPNGKFAPLIRMIRMIGIQNVQKYGDPDIMDTVSIYSLPPELFTVYFTYLSCLLIAYYSHRVY